MSEDNAYQFILNYVYFDKAREDKLKTTTSDSQLITTIVDMAKGDSWPTGNFAGTDVENVLNNHASKYHDSTFFVPPTYETVIQRFRAGDIGGETARW